MPSRDKRGVLPGTALRRRRPARPRPACGRGAPPSTGRRREPAALGYHLTTWPTSPCASLRSWSTLGPPVIWERTS